ncbi:hypothetical protein PAXRUDRAFT_797035, partial [Paxillus rubicundulus Ve08.2h10]
YKSHHKARCKPCVDALVQQTLTLKLDAFAAGRRGTSQKRGMCYHALIFKQELTKMTETSHRYASTLVGTKFYQIWT